ncbi:hypothetical protein KFK09_011536 [Dendrobium nobile]|uniref:Uncharacterized protein n=1 Tax=Dendrobium nobile TaxID=94219 RepID=A0A8T3BG74_DENNO|nr:hypothetical protein KFK09_011536 [Dendrobium nobile]
MLSSSFKGSKLLSKTFQRRKTVVQAFSDAPLSKIGTMASAYGCWTYSKQPISENEETSCLFRGDVEQCHDADLALTGVRDRDSDTFSIYRGEQMHKRVDEGTVILTDVVFWSLLVPFMSYVHFRVNLIMACLHSLNAIFLLVDSALNSLLFPFFGMAYFVLWSCIYVTFQWILHACGLKWWPYPFMDLSTPLAPLWYLAMALIQIPCFSIFYLIAKAKNSYFPKVFPTACRQLFFCEQNGRMFAFTIALEAIAIVLSNSGSNRWQGMIAMGKVIMLAIVDEERRLGLALHLLFMSLLFVFSDSREMQRLHHRFFGSLVTVRLCFAGAEIVSVASSTPLSLPDFVASQRLHVRVSSVMWFHSGCTTNRFKLLFKSPTVQLNYSLEFKLLEPLMFNLSPECKFKYRSPTVRAHRSFESTVHLSSHVCSFEFDRSKYDFTRNFGSLPASPLFRGKLRENWVFPTTRNKGVYGTIVGVSKVERRKGAEERRAPVVGSDLNVVTFEPQEGKAVQGAKSDGKEERELG